MVGDNEEELARLFKTLTTALSIVRFIYLKAGNK